MNIHKFYTNIFLEYPIVSTDSRNITPNCLFFALSGETFNGNTFALHALEQGAAYAIIDDTSLPPHNRCIVVENVLQFLQQLAAYHRTQSKAKILAITGTNGKTTTKELISAVLAQKFSIINTIGNLNNHIGVPLTLLRITAETEIAIIEMGANHEKEIEFLCSIAQPDYAIITNIGKAHLLGFGNFEAIIRTKTELYDFIKAHNGTIFLDFDNEILRRNNKNIQHCISYAFTTKAEYQGEIVHNSIFAAFRFMHHSTQTLIQSQLFGEYNAKNMLAAATIAAHFGVSNEKIKQAIEEYSPINNRSQFKKTAHNTLILDAYNANPTSMRAAIEEFSKVDFAAKTLILGEMFELGNDAAHEHATIINLIDSLHFQSVFLVGNWHCNTQYNHFATAQELKAYLTQNPLTNNYILIKGSRGMKLETVVESL
ncbi:MAG: UDP-N-acetylmuramoyl-tripeptide--D-alanyl-D-alanine ligase [Bacteroidales bacterium]|jgi:UDP-N-acetylmuramoyl-tripeptide--D-alanyl-D-alanine ligase|nr:UDP-N-acetylmuramoyl-tripeptide--D-alanyl-D-alanine ligase [Bacteroidales bacterium]